MALGNPLVDVPASHDDTLWVTAIASCHYEILWVCLKIGYIPNYSHLIGIMIMNHWV